MSFLDICKDSNLSQYSSNITEWESVAKNLPILIEIGTLRTIVSEDLPVLDLNEIKHDLGAMQRMYAAVTFIAHGFIRGNDEDEAITKLPWKIASVWLDLSELLGIPPVATYSATVLFNFNLKKELRTVDDIEIRYTFTGTEDEKWFYAISAAIDLESRDILRISEDLLKCEDPDNSKFLFISERLCEKIQLITRILNRMYEKCKPEIFYNRVRRYLAGWFKDPKFQESQGLVYELSPKGDTVTFNLAGGSAAQNPTIQLIDVILGVKHDGNSSDLTLKGYNDGEGCVLDYLSAMRTYMPPEHANFLNRLEKDLRSSGILEKFKSTEGHGKCLKALSDFRSEHIKMVTRYIICQSARSENVKGTGGSNPLQFLKKCRWDTENANVK